MFTYTGDNTAMKLIPMSAMNPILVSEEDGRSEGFMEFLAKIDMFVVNMIYNPPWRYTRPYTYITSESATQSNVIGGGTSCLQMMTSPARAADTDNTRIWRSEFYRRSVNDLSSTELKMYRTMCLSLERDLPMSALTLFPCFFREIFEKNVLDPSHFVEGGRFFFTHKNVCRFNDTMVRRKRADVPVTDFLYVSSDVVLVDHDKLQRTHVKDNLYGVSTNHLSVLTEEQAARNRLCLWKHKLRYLCTRPTYDIFKTWAPPIASLPCKNDDHHDSGDYQEREKIQSLLPTSCPTLKFDDKCDEIIGTKLAHVAEHCFTYRKHKGNKNNDKNNDNDDNDEDDKEDDGYIVNHENPFDDDDDQYAAAQQHMAYVQLSAQNGRCKKRLPSPSSTTSKSRRQRTTETHNTQRRRR